MEVLDARVDWMSEWDSNPSLKVLVDEVPYIDQIIHDVLELGTGRVFYYGEDDGYVHYLTHDVSDQRGYGGRGFPLWVKGKSEQVVVKGPWSSRAAVANGLGFGPCVDVSITDDPEAFDRGYTFCAGAITLEKATEACNMASKGERVPIILELAYEDTWLTTLSGEQSKIVGSVKERRGRSDVAYYHIPRRDFVGTAYLDRTECIMRQTYLTMESLKTTLPIGSKHSKDIQNIMYRISKHFGKFYGTLRDVVLSEDAPHIANFRR